MEQNTLRIYNQNLFKKLLSAPVTTEASSLIVTDNHNQVITSAADMKDELISNLNIYLNNQTLSTTIIDTFKADQQEVLYHNWFLAEQKLSELKQGKKAITQNNLRSLLYNIINQNLPIVVLQQINQGNAPPPPPPPPPLNNPPQTPIQQQQTRHDPVIDAELDKMFSTITSREMFQYINQINNIGQAAPIHITKPTNERLPYHARTKTTLMNRMTPEFRQELVDLINSQNSSSSSANLLTTPASSSAFSTQSSQGGNGLRRKNTKIKVGRGYTITEEKSKVSPQLKEYEKPIGSGSKFFIDLQKLKSNLLEIKYLKNKHLSGIKSYHISNGAKRIIEDMTFRKSFRHVEYNKLTPIEKNLVRKVMSCFEIYADLDDDDDFQKDFDILKGEIQAGNNSNELKQKMKAYLLHAVQTSRITRHNYQTLCLELGI
jgi:hypothetical protein